MSKSIIHNNINNDAISSTNLNVKNSNMTNLFSNNSSFTNLNTNSTSTTNLSFYNYYISNPTYAYIYSNPNAYGSGNTQAIPNGGSPLTVLTTYWYGGNFYNITNNISSGNAVIQIPGTYLITYSICFTANGTGHRAGTVYKNFSSGIYYYYAYAQIPAVDSTDRTGITSSIVMQCVAGDTISIGAYQTSGGTLDMETGIGGIWTITLLQPNNII